MLALWGKWLLFFAALCPLACTAQQIVNSASGSAYVSPGSLASIYGGTLSDVTGQAASVPLPTSVGRAPFCVLFNWTTANIQNECLAANAPHSAPLLYWSPDQVNFLLPAGTSVGSVLAWQMKSNGTHRALTIPMNLVSQAPGIFTVPTTDCSVGPSGCSQQVSRGILTDANYGLVWSFQPARPGGGYAIWCTGVSSGPAPQVLISTIGLGAISAPVFYSGKTSFAGLDQVNFTMPKGSALVNPCVAGQRVELQIAIKSTTSGIVSNVLSLPALIDSCR